MIIVLSLKAGKERPYALVPLFACFLVDYKNFFTSSIGISSLAHFLKTETTSTSHWVEQSLATLYSTVIRRIPLKLDSADHAVLIKVVMSQFSTPDMFLRNMIVEEHKMLRVPWEVNYKREKKLVFPPFAAWEDNLLSKL